MDRSRRGSDTKSLKLPAGKKSSMDTSAATDRLDQPGLFLANPNASELDEQPSPPTKSPLHKTLSSGDSKERLTQAKGKNRTKSPSFFKILVGKTGLKKMSLDESMKRGDSSSFSDNDEPITFSPTGIMHDDIERQGRIDHIATLPRKSKKISHEKVDRSLSVDYFSSSVENSGSNSLKRMDSSEPNSITDVGEDHIDASMIRNISQSSVMSSISKENTEFHSVGLEALKMLHNQLQILVIQDCDTDMSDIMHEEVSDSLHKQIANLQQVLSQLQESDQNLRLSLKMAEMRAQDAETKLHYSSQRGLRLEEKYFRLEKEYNKLLQNYYGLEKHLQKQALLHQMQLSPTKKVDQRPSSATSNPRRVKSGYNSSPPRFNPVKRHNSSEFLSHHRRQKSATMLEQQGFAESDINPCSTLPTRIHSGSLSHTETRV